MKKVQRDLLLVSFLSALTVLLICSKSSPLYPMNDWVDVQCFFTVGRGMKHGLVPYADLYEQKGPLLYFAFFLAACVSERSFFGVFLLEVLCMTCFLYQGGRLVRTLTGRRRAVLPLLAPTALAVCVSPAFCHGSSLEELFLPALMYSLRVVLSAMHENRPLTRRESFGLGVMAASALFTKYTICGFFPGLALAVLVFYLACGHMRQLSGTVLSAAAGLLALSGAVLAVLALLGALPAMVECYFVNNLTAYAQSQGRAYDPPLGALLKNACWSVPAALGFLSLALRGRKGFLQMAAVFLSALGLGVCTYLNGRSYPYYAMILAAFTPLGMLVPLSIRRGFRLPAWALPALCALSLCVSAGVSYGTGSNVYLMRYEREDLPPWRFAEIISRKDGATLLNDGFLDGGFYYAANILPVNRYFCTFNMTLPEMEQEHRALIAEGAVDFIVTRNARKAPDGPYTLLATASFPFEGREWTYSLWGLAEDAPQE